mmetsp:Transcript_16113/g.38485  ORF Transcript_16113/g.38485 Transcript_16113/m.38485 type:complete len:248 (+) Transcript_16113:713-1456(+)
MPPANRCTSIRIYTSVCLSVSLSACRHEKTLDVMSTNIPAHSERAKGMASGRPLANQCITDSLSRPLPQPRHVCHSFLTGRVMASSCSTSIRLPRGSLAELVAGFLPGGCRPPSPSGASLLTPAVGLVDISILKPPTPPPGRDAIIPTPLISPFGRTAITAALGPSSTSSGLGTVSQGIALDVFFCPEGSPVSLDILRMEASASDAAWVILLASLSAPCGCFSLTGRGKWIICMCWMRFMTSIRVAS